MAARHRQQQAQKEHRHPVVPQPKSDRAPIAAPLSTGGSCSRTSATAARRAFGSLASTAGSRVDQRLQQIDREVDATKISDRNRMVLAAPHVAIDDRLAEQGSRCRPGKHRLGQDRAPSGIRTANPSRENLRQGILQHVANDGDFAQSLGAQRDREILVQHLGDGRAGRSAMTPIGT